MTFKFIFVSIVFLFCWISLRNNMKKQNDKHNLFDDFLHFTGIPFVFFYIIFICLNYKRYIGKTTQEVFNTPLTYCLLGWMLVSVIIFLIRFNKNTKK